MIKFIFKIITLFVLLTLASNSKDFNNIIISGNERISNETILVFSEIPKNKTLDENSINLILKKLFETGFFEDVVVKLKNDNLIINVNENPIIQEVLIDGIKRNKTVESLYDILSLKNRSSFNSNLVKQDEIKILNNLREKGFYFSSVTSSIEDISNKKINLRYTVVQGKKAKISKISFIGDKVFKDSVLRDTIISEEYRFWKFISGKKFLNTDLINFDKKLLNNFYKNKGYYNVNIESSFANYLGDDKFEIIHSILANEKYYFNNIILNLPIDYEETNFSELKILFTELKGKNYSLNSINKILEKIDKIVLNEQYEFLKSTVDEEIIDNKINLIFNISESNEKFYVEKINIFGNNITQEDVIRNNLIVDEGDALNELLQKKTINSIKALNFFKNVKSEIITGSDSTKKIINIFVEEKPTGEITAGAGLGTSGGTLGFSVKENNFMGRGIEFGSDLSLSGNSVKGMFSVDNPNYNGSNRSLNFSAQNTVTDNLQDYGYKSNKTGISIGTGLEYYDDLYLITGISTSTEKLVTDSKASASIRKQEGSYFDTFFNYTVNYDKRNQSYMPSEGYKSKFTQNIPLISDAYTFTNTYEYQLYDKWLNENVASYKFYTSVTTALNDDKVRLSDRLYLPSRKLRGFEAGKIGPKDGADFVGGNYSVALNVSSTLPQILPSLQSTNFSIYFDAANVWGVDYNESINNGSKIRSSIGLAVDISSPIGPLSFSLSEVITKNSTDITEVFRFNLGTTF
jgi:outer membrane protein insertion porin family